MTIYLIARPITELDEWCKDHIGAASAWATDAYANLWAEADNPDIWWWAKKTNYVVIEDERYAASFQRAYSDARVLDGRTIDPPPLFRSV